MLDTFVGLYRLKLDIERQWFSQVKIVSIELTCGDTVFSLAPGHEMRIDVGSDGMKYPYHFFHQNDLETSSARLFIGITSNPRGTFLTFSFCLTVGRSNSLAVCYYDSSCDSELMNQPELRWIKGESHDKSRVTLREIRDMMSFMPEKSYPNLIKFYEARRGEKHEERELVTLLLKLPEDKQKSFIENEVRRFIGAE